MSFLLPSCHTIKCSLFYSLPEPTQLSYESEDVDPGKEAQPLPGRFQTSAYSIPRNPQASGRMLFRSFCIWGIPEQVQIFYPIVLVPSVCVTDRKAYSSAWKIVVCIPKLKFSCTLWFSKYIPALEDCLSFIHDSFV